MTDTNITQPDQDRVFDEFSPKKIILQIQVAIAYLLKSWWKILLAAVIFGIAGILKNYSKNPAYTAEITFALDEGAAQSARSDFSQISEELGMGTTLDAGGVFSSATNIVELMQSRLLVEKVLRSSVNADGKNMLFADFFLDSLDYRDKWIKESPYPKMNFLSAKKDKQLIIFENGIIRNIYETLIAKNIIVDKKGKGTSIVSVVCTSENELFSKYFLEALIDEVTRFYIDTKTRRAKTNVTFLQKRTDSIKNVFVGSLYGKASFTDANINAVRQMATVAGNKQEAEAQIFRNTYADLFRSLENAKTTLMKETPLIQYIDLPVLPLKMNAPGTLKSFIIFSLIGVFITIFFLLVVKVYWNIMKHE
jgi:Chain length determinant protein